MREVGQHAQLFQHAHQQQHAEEKQQRVELDLADVLQGGFVTVEKLHHHEHQRQAEQKHQYRRNAEQNIAADGGQDGSEEQPGHHLVAAVDVHFFLFQHQLPVQAPGQHQ